MAKGAENELISQCELCARQNIAVTKHHSYMEKLI